MRKRIGDRRQHKRYDVDGHWGGTLASTQTLQIANIGRGGALVEALTPLPMHSVYPARLVLRGAETDVRLRVCHVRPLETRASACLLGIEFLDLSPAAATAIDELLLEAEQASEEWEAES